MKDTTGAGDAFVGGFIGELLINQTLDIEKSIKKGIEISQQLISSD